jgi:hypothetical protein
MKKWWLLPITLGVVILCLVAYDGHRKKQRWFQYVEKGRPSPSMRSDQPEDTLKKYIEKDLGEEGVCEIGRYIVIASDEEIRSRALSVLRDSRMEQAMPYVVYALLLDPSPRIRRLAIFAIKFIPNGNVAPALNAAMQQDLDEDVKREAKECLDLIGRKPMN